MIQVLGRRLRRQHKKLALTDLHIGRFVFIRRIAKVSTIERNSGVVTLCLVIGVVWKRPSSDELAAVCDWLRCAGLATTLIGNERCSLRILRNDAAVLL